MKKKAFTLAEVLITLGIIGVVAAMTLPSVVAKYQKVSTTVKLKRTYSLLLQAIERAKLENGDVKYWDFTLYSSAFMKRYIIPHFSVLKIYKVGEMRYDIYSIDKILSNSYFDYLGLPRIVLNDGVMLSFQQQQGSRIVIVVDLNAEKQPNTFGRDLFAFTVSEEGYLLPYGVGGVWGGEGVFDREWLMNGEGRSCGKTGVFCAAVIMMDNWEIKDDYPW